MSANLIAIKTPIYWVHGKNYLGLLQDPAVFLARNTDLYNPSLVNPPKYPAIPQNLATAAREELRAAKKVVTVNWERYQHTQRIAVNIGAADFEPFIIAELDDPEEGLNAAYVRMLYKHVMDWFAKILQTKIDANLNQFNIGIDPNLMLAVYTRKQELCQETARNSGVSISKETMVTTGTKHAVATDGMEVVWCKWMRTIAPNRSWNAWKSHWTQAFQEKCELHKLAGIPFDGMVNLATEADMGDNMITALYNL